MRGTPSRDRERVVDLGAGGGAFAAFVDGECVVDLWTGDAAPGRAWGEETTAVLMSATKGLDAMCAHVLADRGELDIDEPVTTYWPEFGAAGKGATTVRQVLSHQSGAIGVPGADTLLAWDGSGWRDTEAIAAAIAEAPPAWAPGSRHGYHGLTYGWLVGELVRRITGVTIGTFFETEIAAPLAVDCRIGTRGPQVARVSRVLEWTPRRGASPGRLTKLDPESLAGRSVLAGAHGSLFADADGRPRFADFMNTPAVLGAEMPAIGATGTAAAWRAFTARSPRGESLVSRASVERFRAEQVCGPDAVMRTPSRWAVGYTRESPPLVPGLPRQHGPNDGAFGHMGAGGQVGFADPVTGVGVGFVRNHLENQALPLMGASLVATLYECLPAATRRTD